MKAKSKKLTVSDMMGMREKYPKKCTEMLSSLSPLPQDFPPNLSLTVLHQTLNTAAEGMVCAARPKKWLPNSEVRALSEAQRLIRNQLRATDDPNLLAELRGKRRMLLKQIHKITKAVAFQHIDELVQEVEKHKNEARMFKAVQVLRCVDKHPLVVHDTDGKYISTAADKAEEIASFFGTQLSEADLGSLAQFSGPPRPLLSPISTQEVMAGMKKLNNDRACGPDGILAEQYKYGGKMFATKMATIYNQVFEKHLPVETNTGILIPLAKPGKPAGPCSSLRPVTLLNTVRKLFSLIVLFRIRPKLEKEIANFQAGFRPDRSTTEIVLAKRWLISVVCTYEVELYLLGMDLSRAFDRINRGKLMECVDNDARLDEDDRRLVRYLMADMHLRVRVSGVLSSELLSNVGAPQGSSLVGMQQGYRALAFQT